MKELRRGEVAEGSRVEVQRGVEWKCRKEGGASSWRVEELGGRSEVEVCKGR